MEKTASFNPLILEKAFIKGKNIYFVNISDSNKLYRINYNAIINLR